MSLNNDLVQIVLSNGLAVIPTDTIYGIVTSALDSKAVEKVYSLKKSNDQGV